MLGYIRTLIDLLDEFSQSNKEPSGPPKPETGTRTCVAGTDERTDILLRSSKPVKRIDKYLEDNGKDNAFTSFCTRVSAAIQVLTLTPRETIAVNESHKVRNLFVGPFVSPCTSRGC